LRRAMNASAMRLRGTVQFDVLGLTGGTNSSRTAFSSQVLAVAAEIQDSALGAVRLRSLATPSDRSVLAFAADALEPDAMVQTWRRTGSTVSLVNDEMTAAEIVTSVGGLHRPPQVAYVASRFQTWVRGTYCSAIHVDQLGWYVDEFTFRVNHRCYSRSELFHILSSCAMQNVKRDPPKHTEAT
jgi:hypothetical protein